MSLCFCVWLGFLSIKTSCLWSLVKFLFFSDFFGLFLHGPFLNTLSHIKIVLVCDTLFTKTFMNSTFFFISPTQRGLNCRCILRQNEMPCKISVRVMFGPKKKNLQSMLFIIRYHRKNCEVFICK